MSRFAATSLRLRGPIAVSQFARRHAGIITLVSLAGLLRLAVTLAYKPAFWYTDSGGYVGLSAAPLVPHYSRPLGYALLLMVLRPTRTFFTVVAVQHLLGLALGIAVYALLRRRGVGRPLSCLAASLVLFDSLQVTLEHHILTETLLSAVLVGALLVLLWPAVPGTVACAGAGLLVAAAWLVRPSVLPIAVLLAAYLIVRRAGWHRVAAFSVAVALPLLLVMLWVGGRPSPYGSSWTARVLVGRTAGFADCDRLILAPQERSYCPRTPVDQRSDRGDYFVWRGAAAIMVPTEAQVDAMYGFSLAVIRQQPGDYLRAVARDTAPFFLPWQTIGPDSRCLLGRWTLPETTRDPTSYLTHCHADLAPGDFRSAYPNSTHAPPATPLTRALHAYSTYVRTPPIVVTGVFLLTLVALVTGWRSDRRAGRDRAAARDAGLLVAASALIIVPPVFVSMYEIRYGLPALPLVALAGALALHHLRSRPAPRDALTSEPVKVPDHG